jgi:hypothetical protein
MRVYTYIDTHDFRSLPRTMNAVDFIFPCSYLYHVSMQILMTCRVHLTIDADKERQERKRTNKRHNENNTICMLHVDRCDVIANDDFHLIFSSYSSGFSSSSFSSLYIR